MSDEQVARSRIRETDGTELARLSAMAEPLISWEATPGLAQFPCLAMEAVRARRWSIGLELWTSALGNDEEAWCRAVHLMTPGRELVAVSPGRPPLSTSAYRVPLEPLPLREFLGDHSLTEMVMFPEDQSCVIWKDSGEAVVFAGAPAFVAAAIPEGVAQGWASYWEHASTCPTEPLRSYLVDLARRYGPNALPTP